MTLRNSPIYKMPPTILTPIPLNYTFYKMIKSTLTQPSLNYQSEKMSQTTLNTDRTLLFPFTKCQEALVQRPNWIVPVTKNLWKYSHATIKIYKHRFMCNKNDIFNITDWLKDVMRGNDANSFVIPLFFSWNKY